MTTRATLEQMAAVAAQFPHVQHVTQKHIARRLEEMSRGEARDCPASAQGYRCAFTAGHQHDWCAGKHRGEWGMWSRRHSVLFTVLKAHQQLQAEVVRLKDAASVARTVLGLRDDFPTEVLVQAYEARLTTPEAMEALDSGAPLEWVQSYDQNQRGASG